MPDVNDTYGETQAAVRQLQVPRKVAVILGCLLIGIVFSVIIPTSASASISSISVSAGPPFASSFEGGAAMSPPNRVSAWVPAVENRRQGQMLQDFYRTNRLIQGSPGDAYYVYAG